MRDLWKPLLLIAVALLIPIVPFLGFGPQLERSIEQQLHERWPASAMAVAVVGLLAGDIFLPVPSSVVTTVAGRALGVAAGTAVAWLGMTLGTILGFVLARALGRPLALRLAGQRDLDRIDGAARRLGPLVLVLARPVPVLAEASVLFLGVTRLKWRPFLLVTALSNLGIAAVYAALGRWVPLPLALAASLALPLVAMLLARWFWPAAPGDA